MARRKAGPSSRPRTQAAVRISELTRLFDDRWGPMLLPDSDEGFQAARVMAHHIGRLKDAPRRISAWLHTCAPWLAMAERERLIAEVEECPLRWTADKLAWKLKITEADRNRLKITTIGATDLPKAERIKRRKSRKNAARASARRLAGAMTRPDYLATVRRKAEPWKAEGISRATWFRRQRATHAP
jgi:hypothetical protein